MEIHYFEENVEMIDRYTTAPTQQIAAVDNIDPVTPFPKLTEYESAILEELSFPRTYKTLYKVLPMPTPSVRRVMFSLRKKGLVVKSEKTKKWRRTRL
jgi:hypothetical protein